jgi:hypothetical protein
MSIYKEIDQSVSQITHTQFKSYIDGINDTFDNGDTGVGYDL